MVTKCFWLWYNTIMLRLRRKTIFIWAASLGLILWVVGGTLWYTSLYMTPERRFWAAIGNSMRTTSVTKAVVQDTPNGETTQLNRMTFMPIAYADGKTKIYNRTSTQTSSTIVTRTLNTPTDSFVKYESIDTNEKTEEGSNFDFGNVIDKWASTGAEASAEAGPNQQFAESYIQLIPFANLDHAAAQDFVSKLRATDAYEVDYSLVEEDSENDLTVYSVTVNAKSYVTVLSEVFKKMGFGELAALDPTQYDATSTIKIKLALGGDNTVRKIAFSESQFESYQDYGAQVALETPKDPISYVDLQTRLQSAR